jgi:CubicO group peptidase (beta-lactamase class C family)
MSEQDALHALVNDAIARRLFPGAVVYCARGEQVLAHEAFGNTAYDDEYSHPVTPRTLYDVASLTKLFAATAFLLAAREAKVEADAPLHRFLPEFHTTEKADITLRQLLKHASGIELAIQSLTEYSPSQWRAHIAAAPLQSAPGARVLYSCTNYFLLARVIEALGGAPLDAFITKQILEPLGATRLTFAPLQHFPLEEIAPTEIDEASDQPFHGVVHDEAARAWQEYSGHASCGNAGLFASAHGLAQFARLWCDEGVGNHQEILQPSEIARALSDTQLETAPSTRRAWGWQTDAKFYMSEQAPRGSIGHAGFTGPTLWLHPSTREVCVILNNRVYPTRGGPERFPLHRRIALVCQRRVLSTHASCFMLHAHWF